MGNIVQIQEKLEKLIEFGISEKEIIEKYEENILSLKNVSLSYVFAKNIKGSDINAHGNVIIESMNPEWNYYFAKDIRGADIKAHEKVVIESKNPENNYYFARFVKGADIESHLRAAMKYSGPNAHFFFREKLKDKYEILSSYYFIDDTLDEIKKENVPEEYFLICKK